jgi:hypothetical protein
VSVRSGPCLVNLKEFTPNEFLKFDQFGQVLAVPLSVVRATGAARFQKLESNL